jgi:hypothetical protein
METVKIIVTLVIGFLLHCTIVIRTLVALFK